MFLVSVVVFVGYSLSNALSPRDVWTSPLHPMPMYLLGVMVISGSVVALPLVPCCRRSVMIGGTARQGRNKSVATDVPLEAEKEPEPRKDQIFDSADIVWEESFFGI